MSTEKDINDILRKLNKIEEKMEDPKSKLDNYITESEAKRRFKRGTTWFWNLRNSGFPYFKLGGENMYRISDFVRYFESQIDGDWEGFDP